MKKFNPKDYEDWKTIGNLARDFELLTEDNFLEMLAHFSPNPHTTDHYKEKLSFTETLLRLKIEKNLQERMRRVTWFLVLVTAIATFITFA